MKRCTCGPHPRIDLTAAYLEYHKISSSGGGEASSRQEKDDDDELKSCREKIRQACRSHGCFHTSIDFTSLISSTLPIESLAKPMAKVENEIESLFLDAPDFNGGSVKVHMKQSSSLATSQVTEEVTFRGRTAESGDEHQSVPEPKLSWEFCRCLSARMSKSDENRDVPVAVENDEYDRLLNWTKALHSVATVVIHSMGFSQQIAINEKSCNCMYKVAEKCNIDLLRCFRYDAIPDEERDQFLGSSSHTDWGSLTVVWQDDKGGLQTFCSACDKWSDVDATVGQTPDDNNENTTTNKRINLFVHVGDFLSLATHGEGMEHLPIWPSPRHRVICPTQRPGLNESSNCRRSLVYFAYPPPNISLATVQKVIEPLIFNDSRESTIMFHDYSLLHDQSQQDGATAQNGAIVSTHYETYEKMRRRPFGEVIAEKWDQVQRK